MLRERNGTKTMNKDEMRLVGSRLAKEYAVAANAYRDAINEEKRLMASLKAAQKVSHAALPIMDQAQHRASSVAHILSGKCAGNIRSGDAWHMTTTRCANAAKGECPDCGGPYCGVHGKKRSYGYSHSCDAWLELLKTLDIEKEAVA
jgi:hypothetical protein